MTTDSPWIFDRDCLAPALERWRARDPDPQTRERVHERLMDLAKALRIRRR